MSCAKRARVESDVTVRIHSKERGDYGEDSEDHFSDDDGDDLGHQGDYPCTRAFSGDIIAGSQKAGSFTAHLVDRERAGDRFHSACDAESIELQAFGCALFSSNGAPRYPALKSDSSVARGGFVYIDTFNLNAEYRTDGATDVGAAAIHALLSCPQLSDRWTVASYIADSKAVQSAAEVEEEYLAEYGRPIIETVAEKSRMSGIYERMAKDARQFLRAGFAEMDYKTGGWLYLTKRMMKSPPTTHAEALAVPLRLTSEASAAGAVCASANRVGLTEADGRLLEELIMRGSAATTASVLATVDRHVAQGADLTRAGVLQFCVFNGKMELLEPMLTRGAQISGKDGHSGATALMLAAQRIPEQTSRINPQHDSAMVSTLIALGADKNVLDDDGCSALGYYFQAIRRSNDFSATFGEMMEKVGWVDPVLLRMLRPDGGPTVADMNCADDNYTDGYVLTYLL